MTLTLTRSSWLFCILLIHFVLISWHTPHITCSKDEMLLMLRLTFLTQFLIDYFAECITNKTITYPLLIFYFLKISSLLSNLPPPMC